MDFIISEPLKGKKPGNTKKKAYKKVNKVTLSNGTAMIWNYVDDENFCHEANFTKGKSDDNGIRLVFMFRWLSKQHLINPKTNKVVEL